MSTNPFDPLAPPAPEPSDILDRLDEKPFPNGIDPWLWDQIPAIAKAALSRQIDINQEARQEITALRVALAKIKKEINYYHEDTDLDMLNEIIRKALK